MKSLGISLHELKEKIGRQGSQAESVKNQVHYLLNPSSMRSRAMAKPNLIIGDSEVTRGMDMKVNKIRNVLDKLEELNNTLSNLVEWKSNVEKIVLKTDDRRKKLENDQLQFKKLIAQDVLEINEVATLQDEISMMDKEQR